MLVFAIRKFSGLSSVLKLVPMKTKSFHLRRRALIARGRRQREFCCLFSLKKITVFSPVSLDRSSPEARLSSPVEHLPFCLSFCMFSTSLLTGDWDCSSSQPGQPGLGHSVGSALLMSNGCSCYAHCEVWALPTFPLKYSDTPAPDLGPPCWVLQAVDIFTLGWQDGPTLQ